jgi:hypothetical protein
MWAACNQALLPDELLVLTTAPSSAQSSVRPTDMAVLSIVFYNEGQIPVGSKLPLDPTKVQEEQSFRLRLLCCTRRGDARGLHARIRHRPTCQTTTALVCPRFRPHLRVSLAIRGLKRSRQSDTKTLHRRDPWSTRRKSRALNHGV